MATEVIAKEMVNELIHLDKQLHRVLHAWKTEKRTVSLAMLQAHINEALSPLLPDSTAVIREMREKKYG